MKTCESPFVHLTLISIQFAKYDASVVDASACAAAHACQLANGTIVNLDPVLSLLVKVY